MAETQIDNAVAPETQVTDGIPAAFDKAMDSIEQEATTADNAAREANDDTNIDGDAATDGTQASAEPVRAGDAPIEKPAQGDSGIAGIPTEALAAFIMGGWKDEDIRKVADAATAPKQAAPAKQETPAVEELKIELDADIVGADVKSAVEKIVAANNELRKEVASLKGGVQSHQDSLQQQVAQTYNMRIESAFDGLAKDIPGLGLGGKLTQGQQQLRLELHEHARLTSSLRGMPIEKALEHEVRKYKNMDGEKVAEQKVLEKLKKQESQLMNRPTRRAADVKRTFADEAEEKDYRMQQADEKIRAGEV